MGLIFYGLSEDPLFRGIIIGIIIIIGVLLLLAERLKTKFTDDEVLDNLDEWKSAEDLKLSIEKTKDGKLISRDKLYESLRIMEFGKKISSRTILTITKENGLEVYKNVTEYKKT